jgi:hypothetical protein
MQGINPPLNKFISHQDLNSFRWQNVKFFKPLLLPAPFFFITIAFTYSGMAQ